MAEEFDYPADEYLLLGKVAKAHGLRGEVRIFLHSGQPENLQAYKELVLIDRFGEFLGPLIIQKCRGQGKFAIVQLTTVTNRTEAEAIEGRGVLLAKRDLPEIDEDEFYWHRYLGKTVLDPTGRMLGTVEHIFSNGAQDVLVVKGADREILVPVTKENMVGETAGELIVDLPPGLVDLNAGD